jgi:hypothetical protein
MYRCFDPHRLGERYTSIRSLSRAGILHERDPVEATNFMIDKKPGSFLIRRGTRIGGITITLNRLGVYANYTDRIVHWRFIQTEDGKWTGETRKNTYRDINDIITSFDDLLYLIPGDPNVDDL